MLVGGGLIEGVELVGGGGPIQSPDVCIGILMYVSVFMKKNNNVRTFNKSTDRSILLVANKY